MALIGREIPVRIDNVTKRYGAVMAVDRVSLAVEKGSFVTLLGPSGSGKTTLLMILGGFVQPDDGDVFFGERSVVDLPPHKRNIGMVFQNYALFPHMTVFDNIAFPLKLRRNSRSEIVRRVDRALDLVRLPGYGLRRIDELSGGQSQRVALARAIVFEPGIMLMDEPLSALDKKLREQMQVEIRRLHEELGVTTIYVTHDQREALTMSDRIAVINDGRIAQFDKPRAIYERPADTFVAAFIGESALIPVQREADGLSVEGRRIRAAVPPVDGAGPLMLLLRPERLKLLATPGNDIDVNYLPGTMLRTIFQGESILLHVRLPSGAEITVRDLARGERDATSAQVGDAVTVAVHRDDTLIIPATAS